MCSETRWLIRLRWVAAIVTIVLGVANWAWLRLYDMTYEPLALGLFLLAANAMYFGLSRAKRETLRAIDDIVIFDSVQLHVDLLCLTLLTIWTGGVSGPVLPLYFFHMIFASLLQPRARAYLVAIAAVAGLALGLWLSSQWPTELHDVLRAIAWIVAVFGTVYLTNRVARKLYLREVVRARQLDRIRSLSDTTDRQHAALMHTEKMAAMGQLAAGIAHEINNPLASMDSVLQLMQRKGGEANPAGVATLREQVQRILRIVRQLTSYAHPGTSQVEATSINDVVRSALDMLSLNSAMDRVTIETQLADDAGLALVNSQAMQQVLANLLVNAIDATAEREAPRISVRTRRDGAYCHVDVADNGSGIAPEHLSKVFEPFFTTKPVGKGTGLGLSICMRLMQEQSGTLTVESQVGKGSKFVLRLPSAQDQTHDWRQKHQSV